MTTCAVRAAVLVVCAVAAEIVALADAGVSDPAPAARIVGLAIGTISIVALGLFSKRRLPSATRTAVVGFLALCVLTGAITELAGVRLLGQASTTRGLGIVIGAMAMLTGNFFPKTRPLETAASGDRSARAAERSIGWVLLLAGAAFMALFAFAPLERAKPLAAAAGVAALLAIAAIAARAVAAGRSQSRAAPLARGDTSARGTATARARRRQMLALLVAALYVLATACVQYLLAGRPLGHAIAAWMTALSAGAAVVWLIHTLRRRDRRSIG